jgi:hypothetical protein
MRTHKHADSFSIKLAIVGKLAEGFFFNPPEFDRRVRFDVPHGCKTISLEANFQSREQSKVPGSEIWRVLLLDDDRSVQFNCHA